MGGRKKYRRPYNPQNPPVKITFRISLEDRVKCVRYFYRYGNGIAKQTWDYWRLENLKNKIKLPPPSMVAIAKINKKFAATGSVADLSPAEEIFLKRKQKQDERVKLIKEVFLKDPKRTVKSVAEELGLTTHQIYKIKKDHGIQTSAVADHVAVNLKAKIRRLEEKIARLEDLQKQKEKERPVRVPLY